MQTVVKRGDGIMPAVRVKHATRRLTSVQQLTAVFDECVGPARLEASTRRSYQASWRAVLTWGIAHECVESLLPMSKTTVAQSRRCPKNCSWLPGTIRNIWSSIEDRHRRFGHPLPLREFGDVRRLYKAVAAVRGAPTRLIFLWVLIT